MRFTASEKHEIIHLVQGSDLTVKMTLDQLNIDASDAMFFDDTYENVIAGRQFGIESVHVRNSDDVISKLRELELL